MYRCIHILSTITNTPHIVKAPKAWFFPKKEMNDCRIWMELIRSMVSSMAPVNTMVMFFEQDGKKVGTFA